MENAKVNFQDIINEYHSDKYAKNDEAPIITTINGRKFVVPYGMSEDDFIEAFWHLSENSVVKVEKEYQKKLNRDSVYKDMFVNIDGVDVPLPFDIFVEASGKEDAKKMIFEERYREFIQKYSRKAANAYKDKLYSMIDNVSEQRSEIKSEANKKQLQKIG
ncbi:MAG: hypothetical protein LBL47_05155, partial [Lactobacillus sp.]|nr:hypothetical protein [Lactobacillus sp.]